jgi:hypothetical protein
VRNNTRNRILGASLLAAYQILVLLFFGVSSFLEPTKNSTVFIAVFFILHASSQFFVLHLFKNKKAPTAKWWNGISLIFTSFLVGILSVVLGQIQPPFIVSFLLSILLTSFVPATLFILYHYFLEFSRFLATRSSVQESSEESPLGVLKLENTKGRTRLTVPIHKIICFEANDNYVTIYFESESGTLVKKLERLSMLKAEALVQQNGKSFVRIHKSYLINPSFVLEIKGKAQAYRVQMRYIENELPVSRRLDVYELLR